MRTTHAQVRGIYATALQYLDDDQVPVRQQHLMRALDTAIHRRHPGADSRDKRALRHRALDGLDDWRSAATRGELAARLREAAREGLDLDSMPGRPHADVAAGIWSHGAYSSRRVDPDRPASSCLSVGGRPWLHLWTDDPEALNPLVLRASFSDRPEGIRTVSAEVGGMSGCVGTIRPDAASGRPDAVIPVRFLEPIPVLQGATSVGHSD